MFLCFLFSFVFSRRISYPSLLLYYSCISLMYFFFFQIDGTLGDGYSELIFSFFISPHPALSLSVVFLTSRYKLMSIVFVSSLFCGFSFSFFFLTFKFSCHFYILIWMVSYGSVINQKWSQSWGSYDDSCSRGLQKSSNSGNQIPWGILFLK